MPKSITLLIVSFIAIITNPISLTATDTFEVTGLNPTNIVETVPLPEPEPEPEPVTIAAAPANVATPVAYQASTPASAPVSLAPANAISIGGRVLPIVDVADTSVHAGDHVNRYNGRFLYGHNSAGVFSILYSVGVGNVFTIASGGTSTNYQVTDIVIYEKISQTSLRRVDNGKKTSMLYVANGQNSYDLTLMTCYGTSYGNGDASHRYVIYANAV